MPLTLAKTGENLQIQRVAGKPEIRKFLGSLGFVAGETIRIISEHSGNLIVQVKDSRVAVSREMAARILV